MTLVQSTNARLKKITFFAALYFLQGAAFAYVVNFQKPFLAGEGVSKEQLGLFTSFLLLPFIFKVFLGALSDRVPMGRWGSRKPYMVVGLLLFALCYAQLAFVPKPAEDFVYFAVVTWLASLGLALFDTCCDGLAVDVAAENEQGTIQAAMVAGRALGLITMAGGFGLLAGRYGFQMVFLVLAGLAILMVGLVVRIDLVGGAEGRGFGSGGVDVAGGAQWRDLLQPTYFIFAAFGVLYSISSFGTDGIGTLFLSEVRAVDSEGLGVFGAGRGLGALLGAGVFAFLSSRLPLAWIVMGSVTGLGLGCLTFLAHLPVAVGGIVWGVFWGMQETAYVTLAMRFAKGRWAATFFAIAMIFSNLGTAVGEGLGAPMASAYGYPIVFMTFAFIAWLLLPVVVVWKPGK